MKALDFDLSKDLKLNLDTGIARFKENRLVIFDSNSIGVLRQDIINELGFTKAREFFLKFGYQNGYSDFKQMCLNYTFDNEMELLASGPVIHTWEGIVSARLTSIEFDKKKGTIHFTGNWVNSYEAEQHLCYNDISNEPVCWTLMGYASGWTTAFMNDTPTIAIEPVCVGKGDTHCEWLIQHLSAWDPDLLKPYKDAYKEYIG
jgi:hypothetical protein